MQPKLPSRYYVHGDMVEASKDEYFCAACDVFFPRAHFDSCPCEDHINKYQRSLKTFEAMIKRGSSYTRPAQPENLFA